MDEIVLSAATDFSSETLRDAMNAAFSDYQIPMHLTPLGFNQMMQQRGLDRSASKVAVVGGAIAAFWFVSIRGDAAYLISSGTRPTFRGEGLSTRIAQAVLEELRAAKVLSLQAEVLESNEIAQRLYARIGMTQKRRLGCCRISHMLPAAHHDTEVQERPWSDIQRHAASLRDWFPSWQNSDASLSALGEDIACLCATRAGEIIGFVALIKGTNTVAQIAVARGYRRTGVGRALIRAAMRYASGQPLRVINYSATDKSFVAFLEAHQAQPTEGQFELHVCL